NYAYDHDEPEGFSGQNYWPKAPGRQTLYAPVDRGFGRDLRARLEHWAKLRKQRRDQD
ncbi:MAG: AAA family ATPase, partial [Hyphomicrobiales bacterium]